MLETLKSKVNDEVNQWHEEIKEKGGSTQINIAEVFARIFAKNIIHIVFGQDLSDSKLEIMMMTDREN